MIKVIAFDYAGVITPGPLTQWTNDNLKETDEIFKVYKKKSRKWDLGGIKTEEIFKILSYITKVPVDLVWEKIYLKPKPNKNIINLIIKLKRNYKIFLFSNFVGEFLRNLLEKDGITDIFDEIIISSEHKMQKPDPMFFELLVKKSGVKKDEIIFTDDSLKNVEAANRYGIKSFVFTNTKNLIEDLKNESVMV